MDHTQFIDWLLDSSIPTIRYLTLTQLLGYPAAHPEVQEAQQAIMVTGPVPEILGSQTATGQWANEHSYYTPKYTSTHWSLLLLTELAANGRDPGFGRGVDFMLADTAEDGKPFQANTLDLACLWGNLVRYAVHTGRLQDPHTQQIVSLLVRSIKNGGCRCQYNAGLGCAWGVGRALWGLAAIPAAARSPSVREAIKQGTDFLLQQFSLAAADYPVPEGGKIHKLWFRLNFPLFYQVDILFVLRVLAELGVLKRPGAAPALSWLAEKRQRNGRWRGSSPYRSRTWSCIGDRQETDRWVSLQAMMVLQAASLIEPLSSSPP